MLIVRATFFIEKIRDRKNTGSMKRSFFLQLLPIVALLIATGCDSGGNSLPPNPKVQMTLDTDDLTPLVDGFSYKAWARVDGVYWGTNAFNVTETGQFTTAAGQFTDKSFVMAVDITDADLVVISVEGKTGGGDAPSGTVVMAADVTGTTMTLSTSHPAALGADFSSESGQFTIMTPSDSDPANEAHGVWFVTGSGDNISAGLTLPALPEGWAYEGWVITANDGGFSTGKFVANDDQDLSAFYSHPDVPPFPGEDFLLNAPTGVTFPMDLSGHAVSITAEPFPDDTIVPYGITVMQGSIPAGVQGGSVHQLTGSGLGPSATITIF